MPPTDINAANWAKLCEWMEPRRPNLNQLSIGGITGVQWWTPKYGMESRAWGWEPRAQTLDACALAEAEIERRGLWHAYRVMLGESWTQIPPDDRPDTADLLLRLTPAQRTAAMIAAIEAPR